MRRSRDSIVAHIAVDRGRAGSPRRRRSGSPGRARDSVPELRVSASSASRRSARRLERDGIARDARRSGCSARAPGWPVGSARPRPPELVAAGLGPPVEHALISLALNGLRVSEAIGADIEHLGLERCHRTLTIACKGGKVVTIPLAPCTARAIDLAIGERPGGPLFLAADGRRLDRHGAGRIVRKVARRAGIGKSVTPHTLRHAFITADAGVPLRTCKRRRRTRIRGRRCGMTGPAAAWTGMRPTSSPPTSRVPPGKPGGWELFRLAATVARRKVKAVMVTDRSLNLSANRRYV